MRNNEIKVPNGLILTTLTGEPSALHHGARQFCLDVIKEFYGFEYRQDWHSDLDSLVLSESQNHYSPPNRGAFWTLSSNNGELIATGGIRHLGWKANLITAFATRYPNPQAIASLWRVYVRKDQRGRGLGAWLNNHSERVAATLGYATMYLHASSDAVSTLRFWDAQGYTRIGEFGESIHFAKTLSATLTTDTTSTNNEMRG